MNKVIVGSVALFIIVASFKFYNLLNMARDLLDPLLNLPLLKILLNSKLNLLCSCAGGKWASFYNDPF